MHVWAIPTLFGIGALLVLQAAANARLSAAMRSPSAASALQLAIGSLLLLVTVTATGTAAAFGQLGGVTAWHLLGGLGSAVYITAGIVLLPRLGALVTMGLFITGQVLASIVLDTFGLLEVGRQPLTAVTVIATTAVLGGATLIARAQTRTAKTPALAAVAATSATTATAPPTAMPAASRSGGRAALVAFAVIGGVVLPVQGAVNARLHADLDAPFVVATVSFLVATVAMVLILAAMTRRAATHRPQLSALRTVPWWGWLGGLVGASYVTAVFVMLPSIGAAPVIALTVAGQQLASMAVDHYGLLRLPRRPVTRRRLLGVAALLTGVTLLQLT